MYIYIYTYIYIYVYMHIDTHTHTNTRANTCTHTHIHTHTYTHTLSLIYTHVHTYKLIHTYTHTRTQVSDVNKLYTLYTNAASRPPLYILQHQIMLQLLVEAVFDPKIKITTQVQPKYNWYVIAMSRKESNEWNESPHMSVIRSG